MEMSMKDDENGGALVNKTLIITKTLIDNIISNS
jgi:hypothetical protein